jgi:tetratricopeptide (TPR) repeat protein
VAEHEDILGYHLEQAYRYRAELGPVDEHGRTLARQASERLLAAAERAIARGDRPAQVNLLSRAVALLPADDAPRLELTAELGDALLEAGDFAKADAMLAEVIVAAAEGGDRRTGARARVALAELRYSTEPGDIEEHRREAERALPVFEEAGDELGLARAWDLIGSLHHGQGQSAAAQDAWERSIEHARRAGSRPDELSGLTWLAGVAVWGPLHRTDARRRCEEILERVRGDLDEEGHILGLLGCLCALEGKFDEARELHARRTAIFEELALEKSSAWTSHTAGWVEMLAGDAAAAGRILRRGYETLERMGARTQVQVVGSYLARALVMEGRYAEAEHLALTIEQLDPSGIAEIALARCARAKAVAALGRTSRRATSSRPGGPLPSSPSSVAEARWEASRARAEGSRGPSPRVPVAGRPALISSD